METQGATWNCDVCGSTNETFVDSEAGARQVMTEDCRACCHPNLLRITMRSEDEVEIQAVFDE